MMTIDTNYYIKNIFRYVLILTFLVSAVLKIIDFHNTVIMMSDIFNLGFRNTKWIISFLIILEIFISAAIFKNWQENKIIYAGIVCTLCIFFILNIIFMMKGIINCGCMGTLIVSSPQFSSAKNVMLLFIFIFISKPGKQIL